MQMSMQFAYIHFVIFCFFFFRLRWYGISCDIILHSFVFNNTMRDIKRKEVKKKWSPLEIDATEDNDYVHIFVVCWLAGKRKESILECFIFFVCELWRAKEIEGQTERSHEHFG